MKKFIQNKLKEQKGLTLIELLAVIVILAIIAAIAIPAIGNIIENSKYSAVKSDALNTIAAANMYFAENSSATLVSTETLDNGYLDNIGTIPTVDAEKDSITSLTNYVEKTAAGDLKITTTDIKFSGDKTVVFDGATVKAINDDTQKGSAATITDIK